MRLYQVVLKRLVDHQYQAVSAHRYRCLHCGRTFRVYPSGVDNRPTSQSRRGLGAMLYLLGLSYGATSSLLGALGLYQAKSSVYLAVQEAVERVPGLRREGLLSAMRCPALGADVPTVRCKEEWLPLRVTVDAVQGTVVSIDALRAEDAGALAACVVPVGRAMGVEVLVTDDADSF